MYTQKLSCGVIWNNIMLWCDMRSYWILILRGVEGNHHGPKKIGKIDKRFISFKLRAKQEQAVTWWKPAAQTLPVLASSSFVPAPTLPHRTAHILLLAFSCVLLFALVTALPHCLCSESPYLPWPQRVRVMMLVLHINTREAVMSCQLVRKWKLWIWLK